MKREVRERNLHEGVGGLFSVSFIFLHYYNLRI